MGRPISRHDNKRSENYRSSNTIGGLRALLENCSPVRVECRFNLEQLRSARTILGRGPRLGRQDFAARSGKKWREAQSNRLRSWCKLEIELIAEHCATLVQNPIRMKFNARA